MSNHKKGFTLVELLVVIAIIGILSSVVFASLSSARTKAKYASVQSYARALQPAVVLCDDTGGSLTTYAVGTDVCSTAISTTWPAKPTAASGGPTTNLGSAGANALTLTCNSTDCGTAKTCWVSATTSTCY